MGVSSFSINRFRYKSRRKPVPDGQHSRVDGLVSLSVVVSGLFAAIGFKTADPLLGLARITIESAKTLHIDHPHAEHDHKHRTL